jgi:integrase/recombinase XerD
MSKIRQRTESASIVSVLDAVQDFLSSAEVKALRPKTQQEYTYNLTVFGEWCATHSLSQDRQTKVWTAIKPRQKHDAIMLHRVDNQVVHCFLEHLQQTHKPAKANHDQLSTHTLAQYVKDVKIFLNWCVLDEQYAHHVQAIVVARIQKPELEETIIETFSSEQLEALRLACKKEGSYHLQLRDLAILLTLLDTGIRATELVTLTIGHVHLDARDPHIRVYGKGSKWREVGLGEEARRVAQRYVREFRQPTIENHIHAQLVKLPPREQSQVKRQLIQQERLFVNRAGKPLTKSGLEQVIARLGEWAGIEGVRCSPHTFRHTFAINFMRTNDNDIYRLSKLLGHTSVKVTENYLKSWRQSEARKGAKSVVDNL